MKFLASTELCSRIRELSRTSDHIDIAAAWIGKSTALKFILQAAQSSTADVRIVTGIGGYLTDPEILSEVAPHVQLRIYGKPTGQLFHPKLYVFIHGHHRTVWVGSANLTQPGFLSNVESVLEFQDQVGACSTEFGRFWNSNSAVPFANFDIESYAAQRKICMSAIVGTAAEPLIPQDLPNATQDILKSGWIAYVRELRDTGNGAVDGSALEHYLNVLRPGERLIGRDWSVDLSDHDLALMYGKQAYWPFGGLVPITQGKFRGSRGKKNRVILGAVLQEAAAMKHFQEPLVQKVFENLCKIDGCGPALATRLLALARPDIFVVVNKKSYRGLAKRFEVPVPKHISPKLYAELLGKLHQQPWCSSKAPLDGNDLELWRYRTALIDLLVSRRKPDEVDD